MTFLQYLSRLWAEPHVIGITLVWVLFMCFFTYTDLFAALLVSGDTFAPAFQNLQFRTIALCVNIGLVIMLLFDFTSKNERLHRSWIWIVIAGFAIAIMIYLHCRLVANQTHTQLVYPLNCDKLGIALFAVFLSVIFVMKSYTEFSNAIPVTQRQA